MISKTNQQLSPIMNRNFYLPDFMEVINVLKAVAIIILTITNGEIERGF